MKYKVSTLAKADLVGISFYTIERFGYAQAERYATDIDDTFVLLAERPGIGRSCDDLRAGYRKFGFGHHVIFYKVAGGVVEIMRVLHERMDFDVHL